MELVTPALVNIVAVIAIVSGLILGGWWVIGLYSMHSRENEEELQDIDLPGHLHEVLTGIPAVLTIYIIFTAIAMIAYVVAVWQYGVSY